MQEQIIHETHLYLQDFKTKITLSNSLVLMYFLRVRLRYSQSFWKAFLDRLMNSPTRSDRWLKTFTYGYDDILFNS